MAKAALCCPGVYRTCLYAYKYASFVLICFVSEIPLLCCFCTNAAHFLPAAGGTLELSVSPSADALLHELLVCVALLVAAVLVPWGPNLSFNNVHGRHLCFLRPLLACVLRRPLLLRIPGFFPQLRQEHTRELDELVQQAGASGGLGGVGAREMVGELNERINILMAENTVMADQV